VKMGIFGIGSFLLGFSTSSIWADPPCASEHTMERAGNPNMIAPWARSPDPSKYAGGYVGGGCPFRGESRNPQTDGTWGWDYVGRNCWPPRIFINWCHCQSTRPKQGTYKTDAPHIPNILTSTPGPSRQCEGGQPH